MSKTIRDGGLALLLPQYPLSRPRVHAPRRFGRNKGTVLTPHFEGRLLEKLSKAALVDLVWDLLTRMHGEGAMKAEPLKFLADAVEVVLRLRRDRDPILRSITEGHRHIAQREAEEVVG